MQTIDYNLLVKKFIIFNYSNIRNIICNNCLRNLHVISLIIHKTNIFCNQDCFWSYYINDGSLEYKKSYINPEYVLTDKHYIIEYYQWDYKKN